MFNKMKGGGEFSYEEDFDDAALEDELEAILSGKQPARSTTSEQTRPQNPVSNQSNRPAVSAPVRPPQPKTQNLYDFNFDAMKNLNLDDKLDDDEFDEDDPELNAQLAAIVGEELPSYSSNITSAPSRPAPNYPPDYLSNINQSNFIPTNANQASFNQTVQQQNASSNCVMLNNAHFFNQPPLITEQINKPVHNVTKEQLINQRDEYKRLAVDAKRNNDIDNAKAYFRKMKDAESAIECFETGRPIDFSTISPSNSINQSINRQAEMSDIDARKLFKISEPANTMLEALNQRRQKLEATLIKEQAANNTSKVRMMTRLIKQYDNAIKASKAGKPFDYSSLPELPGFDELPKNNLPINQPSRPTTNQSSGSTTNQPNRPIANQTVQQSGTSKLEQLEKSRDEFKKLALVAKRSGDIENAKINLQKMKEMNSAIESLKNIQPSDSIGTSVSNEDGLTDEQKRKLFNAPPPADTLLEALEQRKAKFDSTLKKEQAANNTSKVKMMNRILKQYEQAIKASKLGKEFDYDSLPVPPGFGELPTKMSTKHSPTSQPTQILNAVQPAAPARTKPPFKRTVSVNNKQMDYLLQRQKLFKEAAVESNKKGETTQALDYLRKAKGFTPLIDAVRNGLPIDVTNIPIPPQLEGEDFVMVSKSSENLNLDLDTAEHYRKLELELEKQINLCNKNKEHFFKIGDVSTGSKFEKYLMAMKQDCDMLKTYKQRGEEVPKYHYELKEFSIVVCNTEVSNNEVLFEIIRAIDLPCKQPVDSYVKFEFPFPKDSPQLARTHSAKNTLYPEYDQSFKFSIDRKARSLARIFSKSIKIEIYSKGGFFKSDELIGHVNVDLSSLRTKCTVFDSFPILNGRKEIGGKLQIRIKLREPLLAKQVETIKEKWLHLDLT